MNNALTEEIAGWHLQYIIGPVLYHINAYEI